MSRSLRSLALGVLLAGVLATAGCGANSETSTQEAATTEGIYLEVSGLKYQVQLSRYLNPADPEDAAYLKGLPQGVTLGKDETWFGVFMRVENDGERPAMASSDYQITDTQNDIFRPVPLDTRANSFAYQPEQLQPASVLPGPDTPAGQGVIQGSLVLFKLKEDALQNRPLTLQVGPNQAAHVELDL